MMPHERLMLLSSPKYLLRTDGGGAARLEERLLEQPVNRLKGAADGEAAGKVAARVVVSSL